MKPRANIAMTNAAQFAKIREAVLSPEGRKLYAADVAAEVARSATPRTGAATAR